MAPSCDARAALAPWRLRSAMSPVFCCSRLYQRLLPVCALLAAHCGSSGSPPQMAGVSGNAGSGDQSSGNAGNVGGTSSSGKGGNGNNSFGGAITPVPGAPDCGLGDNAAFCDSFDDIAADNGRAGELSVHKWSGARQQPQAPTGAGSVIGIIDGKIPSCRNGIPDVVGPDKDTLICDANPTLTSKHLLTACAAQNYGQNSYRIRQPFDFTGRTGTIVFDGEGFNI